MRQLEAVLCITNAPHTSVIFRLLSRAYTHTLHSILEVAIVQKAGTGTPQRHFRLFLWIEMRAGSGTQGCLWGHTGSKSWFLIMVFVGLALASTANAGVSFFACKQKLIHFILHNIVEISSCNLLIERAWRNSHESCKQSLSCGTCCLYSLFSCAYVQNSIPVALKTLLNGPYFVLLLCCKRLHYDTEHVERLSKWECSRPPIKSFQLLLLTHISYLQSYYQVQLNI